MPPTSIPSSTTGVSTTLCVNIIAALVFAAGIVVGLASASTSMSGLNNDNSSTSDQEEDVELGGGGGLSSGPDEPNPKLVQHPKIKSDLLQDSASTNGVLTMFTTNTIEELQRALASDDKLIKLSSIHFWVPDPSVVSSFIEDNLKVGDRLFSFTKYSSKENFANIHPDDVIYGNIVTSNNNERTWDCVICTDPLISQVSEEEKGCLSRATTIALQHFRQANVTAADLAKPSGTKHFILKNQPCLECIGCQFHVLYSSTETAEKAINVRLDDHLVECPAFKTTDSYDDYIALKQLKQSDSQTKREAIKIHFQRLARRLCRCTYINPVVYDHQQMVNHARDVHNYQGNMTHENHIPVYKIYERLGMERLIGVILNQANVGTNNASAELDLAWARTQFDELANVDVNWFRDDWEEVWVNKKKGVVLNLMFLYTMRHLQECCAKCGERFTCESFGTERHPADCYCSLFGGSGESNHVRADGAERGSDMANTKGFEVNCRAAIRRTMVDLVWEIGETQYECKKCHNHFGATKPYDDLPDRCFGEYVTDRSILMYSDVQATEECKALHQVIDELICEVNDISYEELQDRVDGAQKSFDFRDIKLFDENEWTEADATRRETYVKQIEYYYEKRSTGGCFLCGPEPNKLWVNNALRTFCGLDGHHVNEEEKDFNPSESVRKNLDEGRTERRKCCPLCRPCHRNVHNIDAVSAAFQEKFDNKYTLEADGTIVLADHDEMNN